MTSNLRNESQVRDFFRPEFLNRLDEVLVFQPLTREQIRQIVDVQVQRLAKHLAEQEIGLEVTDGAKDELARQGFSEEYGARPLKRAIQKNVQNALADAILAGRIQRGDVAVVDNTGEKFWVSPRRGAKAEAEPQTAGT
jgi:ATP-dependent Clp protease ATP-binding subunit ClpA